MSDIAPAVKLRPATPADAELLFTWVNDPDVRRWSFRSAPVAWKTHVEWLAHTLADGGRQLLIAEVDGEPVGQVRLDSEEGGTVVSVSVAAAARGMGLGTALVEAACRMAATELIARVKAENARSLRAFARAGFVESARDGDIVTMRRPAT